MAAVGRRNGVYGGWTHAGSNRVFVRVPTELKRQSAERDRTARTGTDRAPELETTADRPGPRPLLQPIAEAADPRARLRAGRSSRPTCPGFGMSDQPIHPLDIPELADALRRWLLDNELAPAIVVGVAFGCQVAVDLAAAYPASVDRLVLVGPTFDPEARTPGAPGDALGAERAALLAPPGPDDRPRPHRRGALAQRADAAPGPRGSDRGEARGDRGADAGRATRARPPGAGRRGPSGWPS